MTADAESTMTCPIARLADEQARLINALNVLEEKSPLPADSEKYDRTKDDIRAIDDRMRAVVEAASWGRATSHAGAAFQIALASAELDLIATTEPAPADSGDWRVRRTQRLLYSALGALGVDTSAGVFDYYMAARLDEASLMRKAVAEVG